MKIRKLLFGVILASLLCIATIILLELSVIFLFNNSSLLTGNLLEAFRTIYLQKDRKIIQFLPECAIYDPELAYILKPGKSHIENREFTIDYSINSLGVRDDEASLIAPEIIVIGDSHAMGWGVKHNLTFSSLLERKLGRPLLNTAISSYGTVREMKLLERVNLDNLKYLIIQYSHNDMLENRIFATNNKIIPIIAEADFLSFQQKHKQETAYYFGKYSYNLLQVFMKNMKKNIASSPKNLDSGNKTDNESREEVDLFLNTLFHSSIDLRDVVIIVFEVNGDAHNDSLFIDALNERIAAHAASFPAKSIKTIDFSPILGKDKYFRLDDHMNSLGHQAIAEALAELLIALSSNRIHTKTPSPTIHGRP
ncbi:MAG: SGNH/GDSL hydrolase family protein [bacterium]